MHAVDGRVQPEATSRKRVVDLAAGTSIRHQNRRTGVIGVTAVLQSERCTDIRPAEVHRVDHAGGAGSATPDLAYYDIALPVGLLQVQPVSAELVHELLHVTDSAGHQVAVEAVCLRIIVLTMKGYQLGIQRWSRNARSRLNVSFVQFIESECGWLAGSPEFARAAAPPVQLNRE